MFTDDQDIERELKHALRVAPSTGFEARVLGAVERDRPARRFVAPAWLAAAAALVLVAGAWMLVNRQTGETPQAVVGRHGDSEPNRSAPKAEPPVESPAVRSSAAGTTPAVGRSTPPAVRERTLVASAPEVIVPAGQLALIARFVQEANAGRLTLPATDDTPAEPAELVVPPLVVEPVAVTGLEPGGGPIRGPRGLH